MKNDRNKDTMMDFFVECDKKRNQSPLVDKVSLAKRCYHRLYQDDSLPLERYYKGNWYYYR